MSEFQHGWIWAYGEGVLSACVRACVDARVRADLWEQCIYDCLCVCVCVCVCACMRREDKSYNSFIDSFPTNWRRTFSLCYHRVPNGSLTRSLSIVVCVWCVIIHVGVWGV